MSLRRSQCCRIVFRVEVGEKLLTAFENVKLSQCAASGARSRDRICLRTGGLLAGGAAFSECSPIIDEHLTQ